MEHYGLWSLVPPLAAIFLAIRTRQVYLSLGLGIWFGWMILDGGNLLDSIFDTVQSLVEVFGDAGNTRTILFCALVGALIVLIQRSGGVAGFVQRIQQILEYLEERKAGKARLLVPLFAWALGVLIFVETSISSLTVGTLFRPLFDKLKLSREKLAWIADSSSAPASILIPFNGWGAFIMGLLAAQGFADPFYTMFRALVFNFYPMITLFLVPLVLLLGKDWWYMKEAETRVLSEGKVLPDGAQPMVSEDLTGVEPKSGIPLKARNMVLPIAWMVVLMPVVLAYTGWAEVQENTPPAGFIAKIALAIGQGSGSTAVLISVLASIVFAMIFYRFQRIFKLREMMDLAMKGIGGLVPLAILMVFAFAIGSVCKLLGTGAYIASVSEQLVSPGFVPAIVFVSSSIIAFSTGTSWGTFAIMIAIAVPLAQTLGADVHWTIAAALGGGVFGDHCSPISDTTIISSMSAACDHIDHVRTQMPYALLAGGLTLLLYLGYGFIA